MPELIIEQKITFSYDSGRRKANLHNTVFLWKANEKQHEKIKKTKEGAKRAAAEE